MLDFLSHWLIKKLYVPVIRQYSMCINSYTLNICDLICSIYSIVMLEPEIWKKKKNRNKNI